MSCLGRVGCGVVMFTFGAGLVLGLQNRDRVQAWLGRQQTGPLPTVGRPSVDALTRAREKVDSLNGWRADSVVLLADEAAALVAAGLDQAELRIDSLEVELDSGRVSVRGRAPVALLPDEVLGPARGLLGDHVGLELGGPFTFERAERGRWIVDRARVGSLVLPLGLTRRLLDAVAPGAGDAGVPVHLPEGIVGLRVEPGALILHGKGPDS